MSLRSTGFGRVLIIAQTDLDAPAGSARHVVALSQALQRFGHDVCLLAPKKDALEGVRHRRPPSFLRPGLRMEAVLSAMVAQTVRAHRPDMAYVRICPSTSMVPLTLRALRVPYAMELNGDVLGQLERAGRPPQAVEAAQRSLSWAAHHAKAVVCPTMATVRHVKEALGCPRAELVENGVDLDVAVPGDRALAREAFSLDPHMPLLVFVGHLVRDLRLDLLAMAHRRMPGVGLLIVGDGVQRDFVEAMRMATRPSSPVVYAGAQPHPKAICAIQAADLCLSIHERDFALKSLEYAAVGRRQVAFDLEGFERIDDLYPGQQAVVRCRDRQPEALGQALLHGLEAERNLGPLPAEMVAQARPALGWDQKATRLSALFRRWA